MMEASRVLDSGVNPHPDNLAGARRRAKFRLHLDPRHAELVRIEQRLPRSTERREEFFFSVLEPPQEVWKPHHTGRVGVGPVDLLANLEKRAHGRIISGEWGVGSGEWGVGSYFLAREAAFMFAFL